MTARLPVFSSTMGDVTVCMAPAKGDFSPDMNLYLKSTMGFCAYMSDEGPTDAGGRFVHVNLSSPVEAIASRVVIRLVIVA